MTKALKYTVPRTKKKQERQLYSYVKTSSVALLHFQERNPKSLKTTKRLTTRTEKTSCKNIIDRCPRTESAQPFFFSSFPSTPQAPSASSPPSAFFEPSPPLRHRYHRHRLPDCSQLPHRCPYRRHLFPFCGWYDFGSSAAAPKVSPGLGP